MMGKTICLVTRSFDLHVSKLDQLYVSLFVRFDAPYFYLYISLCIVNAKRRSLCTNRVSSKWN